MSDETSHQSIASGHDHSGAWAGTESRPDASSTGVEAADSSTKGILRDAIMKVMDEIEQHEREARKHMERAKELKRDLRESFAFLVEQEGRGKSVKPSAEERPAPTTESGSTEATPDRPVSEPRPAVERKKRRGRRRIRKG